MQYAHVFIILSVVIVTFPRPVANIASYSAFIFSSRHDHIPHTSQQLRLTYIFVRCRRCCCQSVHISTTAQVLSY